MTYNDIVNNSLNSWPVGKFIIEDGYLKLSYNGSLTSAFRHYNPFEYYGKRNVKSLNERLAELNLGNDKEILGFVNEFGLLTDICTSSKPLSEFKREAGLFQLFIKLLAILKNGTDRNLIESIMSDLEVYLDMVVIYQRGTNPSPEEIHATKFLEREKFKRKFKIYTKEIKKEGKYKKEALKHENKAREAGYCGNEPKANKESDLQFDAYIKAKEAKALAEEIATEVKRRVTYSILPAVFTNITKDIHHKIGFTDKKSTVPYWEIKTLLSAIFTMVWMDLESYRLCKHCNKLLIATYKKNRYHPNCAQAVSSKALRERKKIKKTKDTFGLDSLQYKAAVSEFEKWAKQVEFTGKMRIKTTKG